MYASVLCMFYKTGGALDQTEITFTMLVLTSAQQNAIR